VPLPVTCISTKKIDQLQKYHIILTQLKKVFKYNNLVMKYFYQA